MIAAFTWVLVLGWGVAAALLRPPPVIAIAAIVIVALVLRRRGRRTALAGAATLALLAIARPHVDDTGHGRFFADQTYHHQVLRALNHMAAQGADLSEVLQATTHVHAGDAQGWYAAWTALGDRNLARARATRDAQSRGQALLRAHTYYLRAEFFLPPGDPKRRGAFDRDRRAFYEGLDTLGVAYEKIAVPYDGHRLGALYYPAVAPARAPLILFCGGSDTTLEELYFFLVAAARARGYAVLAYEGPGQGAVVREQGVTMIRAWEKPTAAVLDAFLATHPRPAKTVLVGMSMGGYLAARAAAFEPRVDGVVAYDVFFDGAAVARRSLPRAAFALRALGLERLVDLASPLYQRLDPAASAAAVVGGMMFGLSRPLQIADTLATYTLADVAGDIRQDVLALAGTEDQFLGVEQLEQYRRALVRARSVTTRVYDAPSGGAEHSQLGASTLWQADLFDWIADKFERDR